MSYDTRCDTLHNQVRRTGGHTRCFAPRCDTVVCVILSVWWCHTECQRHECISFFLQRLIILNQVHKTGGHTRLFHRLDVTRKCVIPSANLLTRVYLFLLQRQYYTTQGDILVSYDTRCDTEQTALHNTRGYAHTLCVFDMTHIRHIHTPSTQSHCNAHFPANSTKCDKNRIFGFNLSRVLDLQVENFATKDSL